MRLQTRASGLSLSVLLSLGETKAGYPYLVPPTGPRRESVNLSWGRSRSCAPELMMPQCARK